MKDIWKAYKDTILVAGIALLFLIFLIIQHQFLYMHHDDYGYASLSYAYLVDGVSGTNYSLGQIFEFLIGHYQIWGGRILYYFFEIVLLGYTGLAGYRIVQALAIFGIFFVIYKIMCKVLENKIERWKLALTCMLLYGVIEIMTFRTGIFWISAAVSYVIPILFLLIYIYMYMFKIGKKQTNSKSKNILYMCIMGVSIFLATFSQEQVGVASLMFVLIYTVYNAIKNKKLSKLDITMSIIAVVGFAILMLAPGNQLRKEHPTSIDFYQKPLIERTFQGLKSTIEGNFGADNKIFGLFFFTTVLIANVQNIRKKYGNKWINSISILSTAGITFFMFIKTEGYFTYIYNLVSQHKYILGATILFTVLQLGLIAYTITIYLWNKKSEGIINLFYCAIISQGVMIVAPYFASRSSIVFEILYCIIGLKIIGDLYKEKDAKQIITCMMIPFLLICLLNMLMITKGYYENSYVNAQNDQKLRAVSEQIANGEEITQITLKQLPNILYSGEQPYTEGNDYIKYYIRQYYNLPENFVIDYEQ